MYRRGAFHVVVLLLVVLVGSAVAQQLTGTQLLISGGGPHAIGGGANSQIQLFVTGSFTSPSDAYGIDLNSTLSPAPGGAAYGVSLAPIMKKAGSGTHGDFASFNVVPPTIGSGAATLTNASTIKVNGAPSGAVNNYALWVSGGNTQLDGKLHVAADVQIDGNIAAKYQDVAEWVPTAHALAPGTVAVIDTRATNRVISSDRAYDARVAGVVSIRPGVLLGEGGADKTKLAHSGRVKVRADAQYGAIAVGDLLVTSSTPGYAMRSEPMNVGGAQIHRPGTILGKALEPLQEGQGEILVLLTLQ
jgi:hypothetical protein